MGKRFLSLMFSFVMLMSTAPSVLAENETAEKELTQEEIYAQKGFGYEHKLKNVKPMRMLDFEMMHNGSLSKIGFDQIPQGSPYPQESWDGGTAFAAVGGTSIEFAPQDELTSGRYIMSFDIWQNFDVGNYTYMRFNTDTGKTERNTFAIYSGKIGNLANGWGMEGGSATYVKDTWRHVMMFLDFDKGTVDYVIDNEYVMQATTIPDLTSLTMHFEGAANKRRRLDNFTLLEFNSELRAELVELGISMPDAFSDSAEAILKSKYYGNIFETFDEVELNLTLNSNIAEDIVYDAEYVVKNYSGEVVWTNTCEGIEVKAGQSGSTVIRPEVSKYDIYTLYVTLKSRTAGYNEIKIDREFSIVNTPSEGFRSPFIGHQIHTTGNTRFNQVERIVDISGVGFLRTDFGWNGSEPVVGAGYNFRDDMPDYPKFYSKVAKMGIDHIAILSPWHEQYGGWSNREKVAETPQALVDWERFCEDFAAHYKGVIKYIELGNEINFARDEVYSAEEYADVCMAAYKGIKRGNPDAVVMTQGLSRADIDLVRAMFEYADGKPMFDAIALHVYQGQGSPEMCRWGVQTAEFRKLLDEYGYSDMELWNTEGNTSTHYSYSTNQQHAGNLVRQFVQCQGWKVFDKMMLFEIQTEELEAGNNEHFFGMIHGRSTKNANGAKKTYLAVCNYNAMTEGGEVIQAIEGDEEWFMHMKKPNGKSLVVMYGERKCDLVTIETGTKSATLYDISGNPTELFSEDGKYVVSISDQPVYLEYASDKFEIVDKKIEADKYMAYTGKGGVAEYNLTLPEGCEIETVGQENLAVEATQNGTNVNVKITVNELPWLDFKADGGWYGGFDYSEHYMDTGEQIYRDYVHINVKKDGKLMAVADLPLEYAYKTADVYMKVKPYDDTNTKYLELVCEVKNNTSEPLSGTINLNKPAGMGIEPKRVENIPAGETKEVVFQLPAEYNSGWKIYGGNITIDTGEVIDFSLGTVPRSNNYSGEEKSVIIGSLEKRKGEAPVLDGVIDEKEWKNYKIADFDKSQVSYGSQNLVIDGVVEGQSFGADADYGGKMDFSGTVYAQWDEKYLYVAATVNDDVHFQKQNFLRMYYDDHLYITCKDTMNQRHDTRIDIGLSDYYNRDFYTEDDRHGKIMCLYTPVQYATVAYELQTASDAECFVTRKNNTTIYEVKIPWYELLSEKAVEEKQFWLSFNFRDYDGDRDKSTSVGGRWYMLTNTQAKN